MKKHNVVALVGTLALLANLLVPGLAFGQDTSNQAGTVNTICGSNLDASITVAPATAFTFWPDGTSGTMYSQIADQQAYNNPNGAGLDVNEADGVVDGDYVQVTDNRNPSGANCNDGFTVTLAATNPGTGTESRYFDSNDSVASGNYIPLYDATCTPDCGTFIVTSSDVCRTGSTEIGDVCFDANALCGNGDGTIASGCAGTDGTASSDYTGDLFATIATFTGGNADALGTDVNTPTTLDLLTFADNAELFGAAGVGVSYGVNIPGGTPAGVYTLNLEYTLNITPIT